MREKIRKYREPYHMENSNNINNCKYAGGEYCMCSACSAVRKAMEDAEKVTKEEVDRLFNDAKEAIENAGISEKE